MLPQTSTEALLKRPDAASLWAKTHLTSIVNLKLPDKCFRIMCLMAIHIWHSGEAILGYDEIGKAMGLSRSQAIRNIKTLIRLGYVKASKAHNCRNSYLVMLPDMTNADAVPNPPKPARRTLTPCPICKDPCVPRKLTGWCARCTTDARNRKITEHLVEKVVDRKMAGA